MNAVFVRTALPILLIALASALPQFATASEVGSEAGRLGGEPRCAKTFVHEGAQHFLRAASRGNERGLDAALAGPSRFRVFSHAVNYGPQPRHFFSSEDRGEVIAHLLKRQGKGDRMRLDSFTRTGYDPAFKICGFSFSIERRIGGGPWRPFGGKAALNSPSGTVALWNTGKQTHG